MFAIGKQQILCYAQDDSVHRGFQILRALRASVVISRYPTGTFCLYAATCTFHPSASTMASRSCDEADGSP
jgi:hypothetical protein